MSKRTLEQLFDSRSRVKILKFLFRNYPEKYGIGEISARTQERRETVRRELRLLQKMGAILTVVAISKKVL